MRAVLRALDRRLLLMVPAVGCAVLLAACGSSNNSTNASGSSGPRVADSLKFVECMRSHGVSNLPDPSANGGIQIPQGVNPQSPAFQSAQNACAKLMPGPGGGPHASEARKLALFHLAQCMRRHGISTFPDPTSGAPSAPPSGGGIAFGAPGSFLSIPQTTIQSPGFQQAAAACGFPGFGHGGHGGPKATFAPS